jgi:2-methylisocitrate lyase-like PEP mutase family enzyme
MGYAIAVYALSGIQMVAGALDRLMAEIRTQGSTNQNFKGMMTYSALSKVLDIEHYHALWNRFADSGQNEVQA